MAKQSTRIAEYKTSSPIYTLQIDVGYSPGGLNHFGGYYETRHYWVSATLIRHEVMSGQPMKFVEMGSGIRTDLELCKRFNAKRMLKLAEEVKAKLLAGDTLVMQVINRILAKYQFTLGELMS